MVYFANIDISSVLFMKQRVMVQLNNGTIAQKLDQGISSVLVFRKPIKP